MTEPKFRDWPIKSIVWSDLHADHALVTYYDGQTEKVSEEDYAELHRIVLNQHMRSKERLIVKLKRWHRNEPFHQLAMVSPTRQVRGSKVDEDFNKQVHQMQAARYTR